MERKNLGEDEIKTIHVLLAILLDQKQYCYHILQTFTS